MAFPTSPSDGQIYVKGSTPYVYASTTNSWTETTDANLVAGNIKNGVSILGVTGTYTEAGFGHYYITSPVLPFSVGGIGTVPGDFTTYCLTNGNYLYCPVLFSIGGAMWLIMMVISTNEASYPSQSTFGSALGGASLTSIYLDTNKIYFNLGSGWNNNYVMYDAGTNSWDSTYRSGSHTTGTHVTSDLAISGLKYQPSYIYGNDPAGANYVILQPLCKVTKV